MGIGISSIKVHKPFPTLVDLKWEPGICVLLQTLIVHKKSNFVQILFPSKWEHYVEGYFGEQNFTIDLDSLEIDMGDIFDKITGTLTFTDPID